MDQILAVTLAGMKQDADRLERVALNVANLATPGYKGEIDVARPFAELLQEVDEGKKVLAVGTSTARALAASSSVRDMRAGTLRMTGQPLDVALAGDGFFEVQTDAGPAYTRQGSFRVDAQGRLVTQQGNPVMGQNGEIYLTTPKPVIDAAGRITEPDATSGPAATSPGTPIAQIKVVRFEDARDMRRLGDGLFEAGRTPVVISAGVQPQVRQGALENSNVDSAHEMVRMMQTLRHFESMQKVTQGYDEMLGNAIRKLGDLS